MARDSSGNYTLPAGNPVATGTIISTSWANPTMGDLAAEITNSLDRNGRGGMLVPFQNADGTVITPGITFTNEISSGLYRAGLHDVRMANGSDDATRWIDASLAPVGERRPFEIWNGEAWQAPISDGDSITVLDLTVEGVATMQNLTVNGSPLFPDAGFVINNTPTEEAFVYLSLDREGVNKWSVLSRISDDNIEWRNNAGAALMILDQDDATVEITGGLLTAAGGISAGGRNTPNANLSLTAVGAAGAVQLITDGGIGLTVTPAGLTTVNSVTSTSATDSHVMQITRTGGNAAFAGMSTAANRGALFLSSLANPVQFVRANNALLEIGNNGVVGLSVTTSGGVVIPSVGMRIQGTAAIAPANAEVGIYGNTANGAIFRGQGSAFDVSLMNSGGSIVASIPTGSTILRCAGALIAIGDITAFSDVALKSDLAPIESALDKIAQLTGYTYWKDGKRGAGLLANDVEKVLPEAVGKHEGYLTLNDAGVTGLIIEAIKELRHDLAK